ncbi:MAG: hypothetical protein A2152_03200 [Candidatus Levybacteria bacterium RBG_16_35_6]|nr:MAG: hypothetical protein A2152_03200 [Candidatus Levybacteria bacterium RBG_16_35_6]
MRKRAFSFGKKVLKHELITGSFYLFIGTIVSALLAFLINLFFARNLTKPDYGIYASLIALVTLFTIPAQSLTQIVVRFAGDYFAKGETDKLRIFYFRIIKFLFLVASVIFILFFAFSPIIQNFLKLDNFLFVPLIGFIIAISYISIVNVGFLQGMVKFLFISITQISGAAVRLIVGVILVFMGYRVFGALWASILSFIIVFLLGFIPLKFLIKKVKGTSITIPTKELLAYGIPSTIAVLSLSSFISIDVVLVKHFFTPFQAGLYGGLSLIGKVIFYLTGIIPTVMFPLIIRRHAKKEPFKRLFYMAFFLVLVPSVLITSFYFVFPLYSVRFFLGAGYKEIVPYLGIFGAYMTIFCLLNVCVYFFLSMRKTLVFIPLLIGSIFQIGLIALLHNSFLEVILISLIICSLLLVGFLVYFISQSGKLLPQEIGS